MRPHPRLTLLQPSRVLKAESRMADSGQEQIMAIDWCPEMDLSQEQSWSKQANSIDSCSAGEAAKRLKVSESLPHLLKATGPPPQAYMD